MNHQEKKLGLCLSGGGFRAALFHIGTLAALAERGLLHQVEVLSTVSGGSIIGAYYYLKVKQLLEGKRPDCPIPAPEHYLDIVREIEREFLAAVQENLRMRLFLNPYKTARMLLEEEYSRSDRLSELLNRYFYNCISLTDSILLKDIHITPHNAARHFDEAGKFSAGKYNLVEQCKIPILTINATCLNTGHPWHFTGSWLGEPQRPGLYEREQNSTYVLPQLRFDGTHREDPSRKVESWQLDTMAKILLSDAVAASAAVPGIFPPLAIHELYRNSMGEEIVVELSDGGVFDNQGLDALFAAQCTQIIVSDASGQLEDERLLPTDLLRVSQRANDVMMERIRGYGYFDLSLRHEVCGKLPASDPLHTEICFIEDSAFTHLREVAPDTTALPAIPGPCDRQGGAVYRLSSIRTDLDSFSDMEACTLMYQGYSLALDRLDRSGMGTAGAMPQRPWRFLDIRDVIRADLRRLTSHLTVGKRQFLKTFFLAPFSSWAWLLFLLSPLIVYSGFWLYANWKTAIALPQLHMTWGELIPAAALAAIVLLPVSPKVRQAFKTISWLRRVKQNPLAGGVTYLLLIGAMALAALASVAAFIHLAIFNRLFLKIGKLK